jgi:hypothetical protein
MGGKAASQGTGITSGLDEKVNMTNGRANYADGPTTYQDFLKRALSKIEQRDAAMSGMDSLINLGAAQRAGQVLSTEESNNPLDIILNLARSGTEIALPALSEKKKLQLKQLDPTTDLALAKVLKPDSGFGQKVYQMKKQDLANLRKQYYDLEQKLGQAETDEEKSLIQRRMNELEQDVKLIYSGFDTDDDYRKQIMQDYYNQYEAYPSPDYVEKQLKRYKETLGGFFAKGGRVDRQMGSPMMGEQPMQQGMGMEQQDVAMETQNNQGNKVYDMLRARLPQEVSDEVVKLISYNKEAFGDFASIKNQEDVNSFNEKYGVQLVIDVATV